jgi:hypothetical protein
MKNWYEQSKQYGNTRYGVLGPDRISENFAYKNKCAQRKHQSPLKKEMLSKNGKF